MNNIFLTSAAFKVLDKIIPLLPKKPEELNVAFVPTASDPYTEKPWMEEDLKKLQELKFQTKIVDLKNKTQAELEAECTNTDIIFVAGGNTFYLLEKMRNSGFNLLIKNFVEKGRIYIGSSAGSIIVGPNIYYANRVDDQSKAALENNFTGLNLVNFVVLPHWGNPKYKERFRDTLLDIFESDLRVIPLRDSEAIAGEGDKLKFL